jgi:hypothetical protein
MILWRLEKLVATEGRAIFTGFVVAATIPALTIATLWTSTGITPLDGFLTIFVAFYLPSLSATVTLGLPAFLVLRRFRPGNWWLVALVGSGLGLLVAILLHAPSSILADKEGTLMEVISGALAAEVFWLIWRRGLAANQISN